MLGNTKDAPGEQVLYSILTDINVFSEGVPQFDDITMVVLTIQDTPSGEPCMWTSPESDAVFSMQ